MEQHCETFPGAGGGEKLGQWMEVDMVKKSFWAFFYHCLFICVFGLFTDFLFSVYLNMGDIMAC